MARKRIPDEIKAKKGTLRADRINVEAPQYKVEYHKPPDWLNDEAKIEWERMTDILIDEGLFTGVDVACLASYCQLYGRWVEAEKIVKETGLTQLTRNGVTVQNPVVGIANTALKLMNKCLLEFGMTPSSRSNVKSIKKVIKDNPFLKIMEQNG